MRFLIESNITTNCCQIEEQCVLEYEANQFGMTMVTAERDFPQPSVQREAGY